MTKLPVAAALTIEVPTISPKHSDYLADLHRPFCWCPV